MVVRTQHKGCLITGLEVGAANVQRYFPQGTETVALELDHLEIECSLEPCFWQGKPEILDRRLVAWLEEKHFHERPSPKPVPLAMIPNGKNCFKLRPMRSVPLRGKKPEPINPA